MADCGLPQLLIGQAIIPVIGCIRIGVIERPELVIGKCLIRNVIAQLRTPHLDGGELILTFGGQENKPSNLFTGDKRALKAVNRMQCNGVFALDGCHVLVLEEAIRLLMICGDKEQVIARIQAHPLVDKAIDICFRNTGSVDNALNSYIEYPF